MVTTIKTSCGTDVLISVDDFDEVSLHKWHITSRGYVRTQQRVNGKMVHTMLHRMIAQAKSGELVDHINRVKTDNTRENLRISSTFVNCLNRNKNAIKSSKYKGVTKHKNGWQVYVNGKYVGIFKDELEAAFAYDKQVVSVFGDVATTNKGLGLL